MSLVSATSMQQSDFPAYPSLQKEQDNQCPDCLYIDLDYQFPEHLGFQTTPEQNFPTQQELYLTINFNEEWLELFGGRVKFGIRGGELKLVLTNGKIPYKLRNINNPLQLFIKRQIETQQGRESGSSIGGSLSKEQAEITTEQNYKNTESLKKKLKKINCIVSTKGNDEESKWVFEADKSDSILKGNLSKTQLAMVEITGNSHEVIATFEVSNRDICLTDAEGIWPQNISRNKRAIIERLIILKKLAPKLKPYVSKVELKHG